MWRLTFLGLLVLLAAVGCKRKGKQQDEATVQEQEFRVVAHLPTQPQTLHPAHAAQLAAYYLFDYLHPTLTRVDLRTLQTVPLLLSEMPTQVNDSTFTYHIRDSIYWPSGKRFTAYDVLFSLKSVTSNLVNNEGLRPNYNNVHSAQVLPNDSLEFEVTYANPAYSNKWTFNNLYLLSEEQHDRQHVLRDYSIADLRKAPSSGKLKKWATRFNAAGDDHAKAIEGLGPYYIEEWLDDSYIRLNRKSNWWGEGDTSIYLAARPSQIVFRILEEDATVNQELLNGELDVSTYLSTEQYLKLAKEGKFISNYDTGVRPQFTYNTLFINTKAPGLPSKYVRQAIDHLIPTRILINTFAEGRGLVETSFIQQANGDYLNQELQSRGYSITKARRLLEDGGLRKNKEGWVDGSGNPFRIRLLLPNKESTIQAGELMKLALGKAGIEVEVQPLELPKLLEQLTSGDYELAYLSLSSTAEPADPSPLFASESAGGKGLNFSNWNNQAADSILLRISRARTRIERVEEMKEATGTCL